MRRALVLTEESSRHPFRARLPRHVFKFDEPIDGPTGWELSPEDLRRFAQVYCAGLLAVGLFIA